MPSNIRRNAATIREAEKIYTNPDLPIHQDLHGRTDVRLSSRNPLWMKIQQLGSTNYSPEEDWINYWNENDLVNSNLVSDPTSKLPGFDLPRRNWRNLNRIQTNHGRCNYTLNKWNPSVPAQCDCVHPTQTIHHIVNECEIRKFTGRMEELNSVSDDTIACLNGLDIEL